MSDRSAIEWTDATWNPVTGCTEVSPGCDHCYAKTFSERFRGTSGHYYEHGFEVQLRLDKLDAPFKWRKPRRVFVNSMSDLFHKDVPDWYIFSVWRVMAMTPQHTYQILTKRPARMAGWFRTFADAGPVDAPPTLWRPGDDGYATSFGATPEQFEAVRRSGRGSMFGEMVLSWGDPPPGAARPSYDWSEGERWWPTVLPNVWLGVSVEDQKWADVRIPKLLETPAAVRFLSCEPLLGPIDLDALPCGGALHECDECGPNVDPGCIVCSGLPRIDWVIVGGESGPGARPMHPRWARSVRDQCVAAGVPYFFKQWGEWHPSAAIGGVIGARRGSVQMIDGKRLFRVGKKRSGRELDGRTWDEMPRLAR